MATKMSTAVAVLTLLVGASPALAARVSPIEKVLEMLSDLETKIIGEGKDSTKVYTDFAEWCEDSAKDLRFEIKTAKLQIADLTATIDEMTSNIAALETKVGELGDGLAKDQDDLKKATEVREKEAADFAAEEKESLEIIDMLQRAIQILEKEMASGASMLQLKRAGSVADALRAMVDASVFSSADAGRITALVQSSQGESDEDSDEDLSLGAPAGAVYEGHSQGIIETMEGLLTKAQEQLASARKAETSALHNYEMLKQSLEDEIKFAEADMDKAKGSLASDSETKATAEGDLAVTSKDLAGDVKELEGLHHECQTKATEYEDETKSRGEELKALATAKKVIKESTGGAAGQTYDLQQVSLLQLSSRARAGAELSGAGAEAVRFVGDLARKQSSPALAQLSSRMSAILRLGAGTGEDPFEKVKGLIADMLAKLLDEAEADATQKAYCDKEYKETNAKKDDTSAELEKLTTKIDESAAMSAKLKEEVATLQGELAELMKSQAEMDKIRAEEKAVYEKNKPEMEKGLEGVKLALSVLQEYYAKDDKAHDAAEGAGTSIIGLLEVVEADFTKLLAEMIASEEASAASYDKQTKENEVIKVTKDQDVKYKTKEFTSLDKAISELTSDKDTAQTEMNAITEYLEKLNDMCIAKVMPYEERKRRREAEIAGLKEALSILSGDAVFLQEAATRRTLRLKGPRP